MRSTLHPLLACAALLPACAETTTEVVTPAEQAVAPAAAPTRLAKAAHGLDLTGPYRHENLEIFLFEGTDDERCGDYLTLADAIEKGIVEVSEVGGGTSSGQEATVHTLQIRNLGDKPVYVQQGDVVKGGKQDRAIASDFVVPPKSEPIDVAAFCVEHGRWSARSAGMFEFGNSITENCRSLNTKSLKLALRSGSQQAIWKEVADAQTEAAQASALTLTDNSSPSSFVLAFEHPEFQKQIRGCVEALEGLLGEHREARGFAFAINGAVNSIEIFESHALFQRVWSKLLNGAATEAAIVAKEKRSHAKAADVLACIEDAKKAAPNEQRVGKRLRHATAETAGTHASHTWFDGRLLHASYIAK